MRVLVTGASGFVGSAIADALATAGHRVRAASRRPLSDRLAGRVEAVPLPDLASAEDPVPLLAGMDAVVHAAGLAHQPAGTDEARLHAVNAAGAGRLAAASAAEGITRFVLVSSLRAVVGPSAPRAIAESTEPHPTDAYGRSKLAGEQAVSAALPSATVLRPPVVHGAGAEANMARLAALARLPLPLPLGGLAGKRSILSDANLASAVALLLGNDAAKGRVLHLSDGEPLTIGDMVALMRAALGRKPGIVAGLPGLATAAALSALAPQAAARLTADLVVEDAAIRAIGWRPIEPSSEGLARLVRAAGHTRL